uniref:Centromere protein N n=1 Tax=Canis lupus familiaris TaxID=9615 RepID=A0A8I3PIU7_CANLF
MDETVAEFFKRTILKIPMTEMMTILKAWDFLSEKQLQNVNFRQRKESLVQDLVLLCEKKRASVHDAALLDIVYVYSPRQEATERRPDFLGSVHGSIIVSLYSISSAPESLGCFSDE